MADRSGRPDPTTVSTLRDLGEQLDRLRCRAAYGTARPRVSLDRLTRELDLPRSTVHVYVTGRSLPPAEVLDRIVIALGATAAEQRSWADAWYRVAADAHGSAAGAAATAVRRPRQLPPAPAVLVGRDSDVSALATALRPRPSASTPPVVLLHGMPGVGKTALAIRVGHRVAARFPDGQLYVDLHGDESRPTPPAAVLAGLLRALGYAGSPLPESTAELSAAFRTWSAGRRLLVVLDNAAHEDQVQPLLVNGATSATLVTSRDLLAGLDVSLRRRVEPLSDAGSHELLGSIVGAARLQDEAPAAERIVTACAGLPLALRIIAGRLAATPARNVGQLADRLCTDAGPLAELVSPQRSVQASFRTASRSLSANARRGLAELARYGAVSLSGWLVSASLESNGPRTADAVLEELLASNLLDCSAGGPDAPRYLLHDLIRAYGRQLPAAGRPALEHVLGDALVLVANANAAVTARAVTAQLGVRPERAPDELHRINADPTGWVSGEAAVLFAVLRRATESGLAVPASRLLTGLTLFCTRAQALDVLDTAADSCQAAAPTDPEVRLRATLTRSEVLLQRNDYPAARELLQAATAAADQVPDLARADAWRQLAFACASCEDVDGALTAHRTALDTYESLDDRWGIVDCNRGLSAVLRRRDPIRAAEYGYRALQLAENLPDWRINAMIRFGLARLALARADAAAATRLADEAWTLSATAADPVSEGWCAVVRADAYLAADDLDTARSAAQRALALGTGLRRADITAGALTALAQLDARDGDRVAATARIEAASRLHADIDSPLERRHIATVRSALAVPARATAPPNNS